jgi:hypothetical protein
MNTTELRLYLINGSTIGVTSFTAMENGLKIILLLVTIGYTLSKWAKTKEEDDETDK